MAPKQAQSDRRSDLTSQEASPAGAVAAPAPSTIFATRPSLPELEASYQNDPFEYLIEEAISPNGAMRTAAGQTGARTPVGGGVPAIPMACGPRARDTEAMATRVQQPVAHSYGLSDEDSARRFASVLDSICGLWKRFDPN